MNDYELVYLSQEHIDEAKDILYKKYKGFVNNFINSFLCKCGCYNKIDYDDVEIECLLVFENVIDNFDQNKNSSFKSYLWTCLDSKMKDILRSYNSKKNGVYKKIISLDSEINGIKLEDTIYNNKDLIEFNINLDSVNFDNIHSLVKEKLSKFELLIFDFLIKGYFPDEISLLIDVDRKIIYNTIYRLKKKVKKIVGGNYG